MQHPEMVRFVSLRILQEQSAQLWPKDLVPEQRIYETFHQKLLRKDSFRIFCSKTFKFSENSVPKRQKISFPEILET